jgi:hypothetical protein
MPGLGGRGAAGAGATSAGLEAAAALDFGPIIWLTSRTSRAWSSMPSWRPPPVCCRPTSQPRMRADPAGLQAAREQEALEVPHSARSITSRNSGARVERLLA